MPTPIYEASVPVFRQFLGAMSAILNKTGAFADLHRLDQAILLSTRLYPDMFPLAQQYRSASDHAKRASALLAGVVTPEFAETETTIEELRTRLSRTDAFIADLDPTAFEGAEDREVSFKSGGQERRMKGGQYLRHRALPNFFFHTATAHAILRHLGIELGKRDFMGT